MCVGTESRLIRATRRRPLAVYSPLSVLPCRGRINTDMVGHRTTHVNPLFVIDSSVHPTNIWAFLAIS